MFSRAGLDGGGGGHSGGIPALESSIWGLGWCDCSALRYYCEWGLMRRNLHTSCKALDKGEEADVMVHPELGAASSGPEMLPKYSLDQEELDVKIMLDIGFWRPTGEMPNI